MTGATSIIFYIGAHQDDWQLFMSPQAYDDLVADGTKVVFIYTTFGDAGDMRWGQGRSAGAISSIQFALHHPIATVLPQRTDINGHPIATCTIGNTRSYFLNLPDGNGDGKGFAATGNHSLEMLFDGSIPSIAAVVDQQEYATQYESWQDVVTTIRHIVERELQNAAGIPAWVHYLDPRATRHSDHTITGKAVQEVFADDARFQHAMYEEYITPSKPINVHGEDLVRKAGLYLFYAQTAFEWSGRLDQFDDWHLSFVPRQYRVE